MASRNVCMREGRKTGRWTNGCYYCEKDNAVGPGAHKNCAEKCFKKYRRKKEPVRRKFLYIHTDARFYVLFIFFPFVLCYRKVFAVLVFKVYTYHIIPGQIHCEETTRNAWGSEFWGYYIIGGIVSFHQFWISLGMASFPVMIFRF